MIFKKIHLWYITHSPHPYIILLKWGSFFFTFFLIFAGGGIYLIQLQLDCLQHLLSIAQEALSSASTALNGAQNDLSSLSNDFAELNNDLQSTSDALKSVKEDVSPTCKQFLTGKKDLYHAYIKSGGLSVFDKKK